MRRTASLLGFTILAAAAASYGNPTLAAVAASAPQYPPSGFDLTAVDRSTKPGDDFFQHANGGYLARAVIPADRPAVSRRFEMTDRMEAQLHELLQQAATGVAEQ